MKPAKSLGALLLVIGLILAADRPPDSSEAKSADPARAGGAIAAQSTPPTAPRQTRDAVLDLVPADAWLIAYTDDVGKTLEHPLVIHAADSNSNAPAFLKAVSGTFDGSAMLAVSGTPINPLSWRITFAAHTPLTRDQVIERIDTGLLPLWIEMGVVETVGRLEFVDAGQLARLGLSGPLPLSLTVAVRGRVVFGSSQPSTAAAWLEDGQSEASFVDSVEFERLIAGFNGPVGGLIYLDVRSLIPLAGAALDSVLPGLAEALQVDNAECVAIITGARITPHAPSEPAKRAKVGVSPPAPGGTVTRGEEQAQLGSVISDGQTRPGEAGPSRLGPPDLRLAIGIREINAGPWHFIAPTPSDVSLAKCFPPDTTVLIHGSMERASDLVEDLFAIASAIDPQIADEYEAERADFKREVGFDPHTDLLGNFVDQWAFGGRLVRDDFSDRLLAVKIENVKAFKKRMYTLRTAYQLPIRSETYRGFTVNHALRSDVETPEVELPAISQVVSVGSFSYTVANDVLLVAPQSQTLTSAIDAILDGGGMASTELFKGVRNLIPSETSTFVYLDFGRMLAAEWRPDEYAGAPPELRALVDSPSAVAVAVTPYEGMIAIDLVSKAAAGTSVTTTLFRIVIESLQRARVLSARARSTASVRNLLVSCQIYANDHKKQWPQSLTQLVEDGSVSRETLSNPYSSSRSDAQTPYYLYRPITDVSAVEAPAAAVVISEPEIHDGGAVFGFLDGHAEWITPPRAMELLITMQPKQ